MDIRVGGITRKEFNENAKWVVKFTNRHRVIDTYPNIEKRFGEDFLDKYNVSSVELLRYDKQPEILKEFFDTINEINMRYGCMSIPEIFGRFGVRC